MVRKLSHHINRLTIGGHRKRKAGAKAGARARARARARTRIVHMILGMIDADLAVAIVKLVLPPTRLLQQLL